MIPVIVFGALAFLPRPVHAATLFVAPSGGQFAVGQTFNVVISVNSQGVPINASEGVLSFNPSQLQVQSITSAGSIFNLNVQEPTFSNANGTVRWTGIILNPGFNGSAGNLLTVRFKGVAPGPAAVKFASGAVLANDGAGTNVLSGFSGGTYTIGTAVGPSPTPVPTGKGPVVSSPTHPDPSQWYNNNDPIFRWELPPDVDGVSYLVHEKADANPGNSSDGLVSEVRYADLPDGTSYFHVKFLIGSTWGPITHFPFNIDTVAPNAFVIIREDADDPTNPRPVLSYSTTDSGSGVFKYVMKIGDGEWFDVPEASEDEPFAMPLQMPGTRTVEVEAVDRAGNSTSARTEITVEPITRPVITRWPASVPKDTPFDVSGTAGASVTVSVRAVRTSSVFGHLLYTDTPEAVVETQSDAGGNWSVRFGALEPGRYRLEAIAFDSREAYSLPSEPVTVKVGYGILARIVEWLRAFFTGNSGPLWAIRGSVLILLLLLILLITRRRGVSRTFFAGAVKDEQRERVKLEELIADMDDELSLLEKMSQNRPLYPEERYLRSKLSQYRKTLRVIAREPRSRLAKRK